VVRRHPGYGSDSNLAGELRPQVEAMALPEFCGTSLSGRSNDTKSADGNVPSAPGRYG
jgi:hypothetical protein